jgi:translation initiation factor 1
MGKKKNKRIKGDPQVDSIVYSTHSIGNSFFDEIKIDSSEEPFSKKSQELRVYRDKKQRRGKVVTIVIGYRGNLEELKKLGKSLKSNFGVGGSVKDNQILIQGDFADKTVEWLRVKGYSNTKRTGA